MPDNHRDPVRLDEVQHTRPVPEHGQPLPQLGRAPRPAEHRARGGAHRERSARLVDARAVERARCMSAGGGAAHARTWLLGARPPKRHTLSCSLQLPACLLYTSDAADE